MNLDYWHTQREFNDTTLKRFAADEARLVACGCGAERALIAIAGGPRLCRARELPAPSPR
jgi:hypothetical protein